MVLSVKEINQITFSIFWEINSSKIEETGFSQVDCNVVVILRNVTTICTGNVIALGPATIEGPACRDLIEMFFHKPRIHAHSYNYSTTARVCLVFDSVPIYVSVPCHGSHSYLYCYCALTGPGEMPLHCVLTLLFYLSVSLFCDFLISL